MKAIVTKQNDDGTFNEVGMNTRTVLGPYKQENFILKRAREYANGKGYRVEFFPDSFVGNPVKVLKFEGEQKILEKRILENLKHYANIEDLSLPDKLFRQIIAERIFEDLSAERNAA